MPEVDYKKPALIGGLIVGLLSVVPILGNCSCLWALLGGVVAAKMVVTNSPLPLTSSHGAKAGIFTGLIGAAIHTLIQLPILIWQMSKWRDEQPPIPPFVSEEVRATTQRLMESPMFKFILVILVVLVGILILLGFAVLGGVLGIALFEKRTNQVPPSYPPPPGYPQNYPQNYPPTTPSGYPPAAPPSHPPETPPSDPPPSGGREGGEGSGGSA